MPLHLPSIERRQFLRTLGGGLATFAAAESMFASDQVDESLVYLLNDPHIGEKQPSDSLIPAHFREAVDEVLGLETPPAALLINGDLALRDGQPGDYRHFAKLLAPLREANINLHLTLGNHDNRETFYDVLREERPAEPPIESRHISVVQSRHANFFLLDSLMETMVTQGKIGETQSAWLARALDNHPDKAAIIVTHHNPRLGGDPDHFPGGLTDSEELWQVLEPRKQVKAYIHGHIHHWSLAEHQGIHIINTPATSYVGNREISTTGWTVARFHPDGVELTLRTHEPDHAWNGKVSNMVWR